MNNRWNFETFWFHTLRWASAEEANKEMFFYSVLKTLFLFLRNFIMQSCVCGWTARYLIFSLIVKFFSWSQKKSLECATWERFCCLCLLTINLFFLIKCPTPVIELWRQRRQRGEKIFTLKQWTQNKGTDTMFETSLIFLFTKSRQNMLFVWGTSIPSPSLIPYVFSPKRKNLTSELCCQRINDSWNENKRVKFLSGTSKGETWNFRKVLIYLKAEENVLFSCKCIIKCKQMISNANHKSQNVWRIV